MSAVPPAAHPPSPADAPRAAVGRPIEPIAPGRRIEALDVLRGAALLGIFVMNMPGFSSSFHLPMDASPYPHDRQGPVDGATLLLMGWLFEGRFNGLFSFLFGIGLALQLQRLQTAPGVVVRRMAALMAFGVLHNVLLWTGDVLHVYAVLGLLLMFTVQASARAWATAAVALYGLQVLHGVITALSWTEAGHLAEQAFLNAEMARDNAVYGGPSWWAGVVLRAEQSITSYLNPHTAWPIAWFWLALLNTAALGLWALKSGWLTDRPPGGRPVLTLLVAGSLLWAAAHALLEDFDPAVAPSALHVLAWALGDLARLVLVLAYAGAVLLLGRSGRAPGLRRALADVGRMPLTNYLAQSLVATFIFHGWGLGLWGRLTAAEHTLLALVLFGAVQVPLSRVWLRHHEWGPMEAVWRRLSYGASSRSAA